MARSQKPPTVNPFQGELFPASIDGAGLSSGLGAPPAEKVLGYRESPTVKFGEPGSYVDIAGRAEYLLEAIAEINQVVLRKGFATASNVPEHDSPIWARYKGGTPIVQAGARRNADLHAEAAKLAWWKSTGYGPARRIKLEPRHTLEARAEQDWENFIDDYGGRRSGPKRKELQKQLRRSIRVSKMIVKKAAKSQEAA
jgi:hypothetical protein